MGFPGKRSRGIAEEFCGVAEDLNARKIVGRFSTFLEHVKPSVGGVRVTRSTLCFIGRCRRAVKLRPEVRSVAITF